MCIDTDFFFVNPCYYLQYRLMQMVLTLPFALVIELEDGLQVGGIVLRHTSTTLNNMFENVEFIQQWGSFGAKLANSILIGHQFSVGVIIKLITL